MFHPRFVPFLVILLSSSLISACGGGGGGGGGGNTPPPPANTAPVANGQSLDINENTPLAVTLTGSDADGDDLSFTVITNPTNGTLSGTAPDLTYTPDSAYSGSDSFTFTVNDGTEDSSAATVNITVNEFYFSIGGTVTGNQNPGLILENSGGDSLEVAGIGFEFPTHLVDDSNYDVTLAAVPEHQLCSVDNATGTVAGADVDDISVLCRYWRTAEPLENGTGAAGSPQIAFDSSGNAIAVWIQHDGAQDNVWANTYSPSGGWGTAELIGDENGDAQAPQVAFDSDGNAIAVWTQQGSTYSNVWFNYYSSDSDGWRATGAGLLEHNPGDASNTQIAVDSADNAIVVWEQNGDPATTPNPFNIWATTFSPDPNIWSTAELIETDGGAASVPQIAFDSAGNALAVWHQYDGSTNYNIRANLWSSDIGDWNTPITIESNDDGHSWSPQIAVDSADQATIVWEGNDGDRFNIWATTYAFDSDELGTEEVIETDNAGNAYDPLIAVDSLGNVIAVWRQHNGTRYDSWANVYSPDGGWGSAELIETGDGSAGGQQIAFDSLGNAIAVWRSGDILANTWSPGIGWGTATFIETDNGVATDPQIAFDNAGNAIAVWSQNDDIQVNYFR